MDRTNVSSGSPWEPRIGFSRAVRIGKQICVSGTAPIWPDGSCDPDPYEQARRCLTIIAEALKEAGAEPENVIRTRTYLIDAGDVEAVAKAHSEFFASVRPASTMVIVTGFLDDRWKVEMEADAVLA